MTQIDIAEESKESKTVESYDIDKALGVIFKDITKYAPAKIVGTLVNLLTVHIYTNLMMPEQYGLYMVATGVISFLAIIFSDWIGISALRFFREHFKTDNVKSYFSTVLLLMVINLSVMYLLSFVFFDLITEHFKIEPKFLMIVLALMIPIPVRALMFQILRAQIKPLCYTFSIILNQLTTVAFACYFITQYHMGAEAILFGMGLSITFIDSIMLFQTRFYKSIHFGKMNVKILGGLYKYGTPLALSSLGMWLITQSDRFVVQHIKGSEYNGHLGVGYNLTFSIMMPLVSILGLAAIPRIINYYEDNNDVRPIITKLAGMYFRWFLPLAFFLCIYAEEMVKIFSNKNFENAHILIPFLAISAFCLGLADLTTLQYHLVKKTYINMYLRLVSGAFGIALNIILLQTLGLFAVGISALASQFLYLLLSYVIKIKHIDWIFPITSVTKTFIAIIAGFGMTLLARYFIGAGNMLLFLTHAGAFVLTYIAVIKYLPLFNECER